MTMLFRYVLALALATGCAALIQHYYSFSHQDLMVIAAFLVAQTRVMYSLRQGFICCLIILAAAIVAQLILLFSPHKIIIDVLIGFVIFLSSIWLIRQQPLSKQQYFLSSVFAMLVLFFIFSKHRQPITLNDQFIDIIIGSFIGLLAAYFFANKRNYARLEAQLPPILHSMQAYVQALIDTLNDHGLSHAKLNQAYDLLQGQLVKAYPEWVFDQGFNPGLRAGFRFFLVKLDQVVDLLFCLQPIDRGLLELDVFEKINPHLVQVLKNNQLLILSLINFFENKNYVDMVEDLRSDMQALELSLQAVVPVSLEALSIYPHYLAMTTMVRDIKDMRELLLQLLLSLPNGK